MKYWALLTARIVARLGLLLIVLLWWHARSSEYLVATRLAPGAIAIGSSPMGISILRAPQVTLPNRVYWRHRVSDPALDGAGFFAHCREHGLSLPGIYYYDVPRVPGGRGSHCVIRHWLIFLTFLIATIATSVRWRKPVTEAPAEQVDE